MSHTLYIGAREDRITKNIYVGVLYVYGWKNNPTYFITCT